MTCHVFQGWNKKYDEWVEQIGCCKTDPDAEAGKKKPKLSHPNRAANRSRPKASYCLNYPDCESLGEAGWQRQLFNMCFASIKVAEVSCALPENVGCKNCIVCS
jgi:hypothetical protein